MNVPLDRLYQYIESIAQKIRDDVIIYHFYPHGSKKVEDLICLCPNRDPNTFITEPNLYCNDQEPLNYDFYSRTTGLITNNQWITNLFDQHNITLPDKNFRNHIFNIYDQSLLLHSELRSSEVEKYQKNNFIPVYYWAHAVIARDWYRYAQHVKFKKNTITKRFLIYNRAWSGTREYRLKFADLLVENQLLESCKTTLNAQEPETNQHYREFIFRNSTWKPNHKLENFFNPNTSSSSYSADFDINDYNSTNFEIVLETLFDDQRLHLTEKTLRPIACGQPFLLCATHGSLDYLKRYGFKTFDSIIDESYDNIVDPLLRMQAVIKEMKKIQQWNDSELAEKLNKIQPILEHNRQHFFSEDFFNLLITELKNNLQHGFDTLELTNTSEWFFQLRKLLARVPELKDIITNDNQSRTRQDIVKWIKKAKQYQQRNNKTR